MLSNRQIFNNLEQWLISKLPHEFRYVWIDYEGYENLNYEKDLFDKYQSLQSFILEKICIKNNLPYEICTTPYPSSEEEKYKLYSKFFDWKSKNCKTLLVSKTLKEQFHFGEYQKYFFDDLDLLPFVSFTQSKVDNLYNYIVNNEELISVPINSKLEWLYNQDVLFKIVSSSQDPTKNPMWGSYSIDKKELIAKFYALYKARQHKIEKDNIFKYEL